MVVMCVLYNYPSIKLVKNGKQKQKQKKITW